ncbi:MAG: hypothetical protein ACXVCE_10460 [Bacteriovorax sp.]
MEVKTVNKGLIFESRKEDFFKIFFATFLLFLLSFNSAFLSSSLVFLITAYLLDGGHVYSTMLEVYADPEEAKKPYIWAITLLSFFLNLAVLVFFPPYFFYYIFYFTVFHNMRQGLGVTFLYKKGEKEGLLFYKYSYYFLTVIPFILFHFRHRDIGERLGEGIVKNIDLFQFFPEKIILSIYQYGVYFYVLGALAIIAYVYLKKNFRGLWSMSFFGGVYALSFLVFRNELQSYILLIASHAIPYYFLMEKRIAKTHSLSAIKKYAPLFLIMFFYPYLFLRK